MKTVILLAMKEHLRSDLTLGLRKRARMSEPRNFGLRTRNLKARNRKSAGSADGFEDQPITGFTALAIRLGHSGCLVETSMRGRGAFPLNF